MRKQLRCSQVLAFFAALAPCLIGMKACATAHYWARELTKLGPKVRLMPAKDVKAYLKRNKNDAADAAATMRAGRKGATRPIGLGFRALKGGSAVVGVILDQGEPRVVVSTFLPTAVEGDRLALEPYRVAYEMKRGPGGKASREAAAAVAEGHKRQRELPAKGLGDIVRSLRDAGCERVIAALLVNRVGWITDALAYSLSWLEHVPVAEGLAVRDALRFACGRYGVEVAEVDEKSLYEVASKQLRLSPHDIDIRLKSLGVRVDRPWRREQKLACLSAWVTVAELR